MSRGAEPSRGFAAQRRKRAGRGYMLPLPGGEHGLPLRQRMLPPRCRNRTADPARRRHSWPCEWKVQRYYGYSLRRQRHAATLP